MNAEFVTRVFTENGVEASALHILAVITGATIIRTAAWNVIDAWRKAARDTRRAALLRGCSNHD